MLKAGFTIISEGIKRKYLADIVNYCPLRSNKAIKINFAEQFQAHNES